MSREIKFRGRSLYDENQWVYGLFFKSGSEGQWTEIQMENGPTVYVDEETICQFTGLKDKNGKEIYEGDIVYWEIDNGVGIESYSAVVRWSENTEKYKDIYKWLVVYTTDYLRGDFDELTTPAAYNDGLQVIGNVWEDGELLNDRE